MLNGNKSHLLHCKSCPEKGRHSVAFRMICKLNDWKFPAAFV